MQISKRSVLEGLAIAIFGLVLAFLLDAFIPQGGEMEQGEMPMPPQEIVIGEEPSLDPSF